MTKAAIQTYLFYIILFYFILFYFMEVSVNAGDNKQLISIRFVLQNINIERNVGIKQILINQILIVYSSICRKVAMNSIENVST